MKRSLVVLLVLVSLPLFAQKKKAAATASAPYLSSPITVDVDASSAPQRIFHAKLSIPVNAGPIDLLYPKWIPGEHAPDGPIVDLAGLHFSANGQALAWRRDLEEPFEFHVTVPSGASTLEVTLDFLSPSEAGGFSAGSSATAAMTVVSWNQLLLYPKGPTADQLTYTASLKLPEGWKFGTALPLADGKATVLNQNAPTGVIQFAPATLERLVDSPVIAGIHYRAIDLGNHDGLHHEIDAAADSEAALQISPELQKKYENLVVEAGTLYAARHYRDYHFLLSLSDHVAHFGLEHNESSDDRIEESGITDPDMIKLASTLLPHEYTHSWNGKYRRPAGLATPDYEKPMHDDLLWVYEGLTQYLGTVLTARSGLWDEATTRDFLANTAAYLDQRSGRLWRPLQDTADDAQVLYFSPGYWDDYRRSTDFYDEAILLWMDVDTTIRGLTHGQKSIDDFCHIFHGGQSGQPGVKPYTFDEVVATLNQVAPNDWAKFLRTRLDYIGKGAPEMDGLTNAGWKIEYTDQPNDYWKLQQKVARRGRYAGQNLRYSLGIMLNKEGAVSDVIYGSPAYLAGIAPGMKLIAVNDRGYTEGMMGGVMEGVMDDALRTARTDKNPIRLLMENGGWYKTYNIDYHDGARYPHLVPNGKPDLLKEILAPHATGAPAAH